MSELKICLTKSQADFVSLVQDKECDNCLFVGGPGCGKSYLLGLVAVLLVQHSKDANIYIYAPEHHHIRTIEVPNVILWLDQFKIKHRGYNSHENVIKIDSPVCGDIFFKPMDNPSAMVGYQSYAALIDELDTIQEDKADEIYRAVMMRNRQQPSDVPEEYRRKDAESGRMVCMNKIISFTTPEGYNFCYKNWELRKHPDYQQIKGRTADNPTVTSKYLEQIRERFPAHVAEAYLNGEFINMQSLSVYFNYNPDLHDSNEEIVRGENLYIGCDFNVDNTSATIFVKRNGGHEWHAVEEMTGIRDSATLAAIIYDRYASKGHQIFMYPDSTGGNRSNANASLSALNELRDKGFVIRSYSKNKNADIKDRVDATNKGFGQGRVFINQRKCPTVARCLVNQPYNKDGKPCKKTGYDHQNDATTYPLVYEMGPKPKLFAIKYSFARKR